MMEPVRFEIVEETAKPKSPKIDKLKRERNSSLSRLIKNSQHITELFSTTKELKKLRFDELEMLRDIRDIVESDPAVFENVEHPTQYRREIRAKILPKYINKEFIRSAHDKILGQLIQCSDRPKDQDALMTALVFLQSHTDLGVPHEDNPLWEIIFNLSIKDGISFVDSLAALIEGLDTLKDRDPQALTQEPLLLKFTRQVCQWPIFWRQVVENKNIEPYESLVSAVLRGGLIIELYFDEIIHLPYLLHLHFKDLIYREGFSFDELSESEKEEISKKFFKLILECATRDFQSLLPVLADRINKLKVKTMKDKDQQKAADFVNLLHALQEKDDVNENPLLLTILIAKMSIRKYWENRRDFFFFFTILKNPEEPRNYFDYGQILYQQKHPEAIERVFQCALEIDGDSFWGYWGLGNLQLKQSDFFESEQNLHNALKIVQQLEILAPGNLKRELFLIKEDIKKLSLRKVKKQVNSQQQISLF